MSSEALAEHGGVRVNSSCVARSDVVTSFEMEGGTSGLSAFGNDRACGRQSDLREGEEFEVCNTSNEIF